MMILFFGVCVASLSQILLKLATTKGYKEGIREYLNVYVLVGYSLLICSTVLVVIAFKKVDYRNGPIIESLGYPIILISSKLLFGERITIRKAVGNILIVAGIVIFYM